MEIQISFVIWIILTSTHLAHASFSFTSLVESCCHSNKGNVIPSNPNNLFFFLFTHWHSWLCQSFRACVPNSVKNCLSVKYCETHVNRTRCFGEVRALDKQADYRNEFEFEITLPTIFHLRVLDNNAFTCFHHFLPGKWDTTSLLGFLAALSLISSSVAIKACLDECKVWPSCRRFVDQTPRWKPQTWHWTHQGWKIETQKDIMRAS